jgi:heme A synthase
VLLPIFYGVGYRHQTSGFLPHIAAALLVAGLILMLCVALNERNPANAKLRRACNLTIAAVLFQVVLGIAAFMIRLLEIEAGLLLAIVRALHITGAAPVLAASIELAIQYRRGAAGDGVPDPISPTAPMPYRPAATLGRP